MYMATTWIVAADSNRARIFQTHSKQDHLQEIEDFANPAAHAKPTELETDNLGRFRGENMTASAREPKVDAVEHEIELFVKDVSDYLDKARTEHRYDKLCVIAFPKFLGRLRHDLSKEVQKLVEEEVPKDISGLDAREIEDYVRNRLH
jgi:protein required for attachment to host cells